MVTAAVPSEDPISAKWWPKPIGSTLLHSGCSILVPFFSSLLSSSLWTQLYPTTLMLFSVLPFFQCFNKSSFCLSATYYSQLFVQFKQLCNHTIANYLSNLHVSVDFANSTVSLNHNTEIFRKQKNNQKKFENFFSSFFRTSTRAY